MSSLPGTNHLAVWISRALKRYDARAIRRASVNSSFPGNPENNDDDTLETIERLAREEIALIREVLDARFAGGHVSSELAAALRATHRRGWAVRQDDTESALDVELGWLQGFGTFALLADLSELDRATLEHELDHRTIELQRALILRRTRRSSDRNPPLS